MALWMNQSCSVLGVVIGRRQRDAVAFRGLVLSRVYLCLTTKVVRWGVGRLLHIAKKFSKIQ